jgi:hypothetical protein
VIRRKLVQIPGGPELGELTDSERPLGHVFNSFTVNVFYEVLQVDANGKEMAFSNLK